MSKTIAITFRFRGTNIETGHNLVHQETHHVLRSDFSRNSFLQKVDSLFPKNLWANKCLEIIDEL
ncbi:MAG TPA: hypothetical protein PLK76_03430 [bacterium]|nr:hypothetical protein [bacterium]